MVASALAMPNDDFASVMVWPCPSEGGLRVRSFRPDVMSNAFNQMIEGLMQPLPPWRVDLLMPKAHRAIG